jgi:hypothetical protein
MAENGLDVVTHPSYAEGRDGRLMVLGRPQAKVTKETKVKRSGHGSSFLECLPSKC